MQVVERAADEDADDLPGGGHLLTPFHGFLGLHFLTAQRKKNLAPDIIQSVKKIVTSLGNLHNLKSD